MPRQRLILNLRGGLGNQLFGIYAAMALENQFGIGCEIHRHGIDRSHNSGNSDATAFQFGRKLNFANRRSLSERLLNKALTRKLSGTITLNSVFIGHYFEKNDRENSLNDLHNLLAKSKRVVVDGYFQDFGYFNQVKNLLPVFTLDETTTWLESQKEQAKALQPIMIHIRLGDYLQNGMQILTKNYFNEALLEMSKLAKTDDVWVFSDSPDQARQYLDLPASKKVSFLANNQKSTETLLLMREGSGLICSNSTFSYWAGITGHHSRPVIYPERFSQKSEINVRNIPEEWIPFNV
jgi:hypothetical protein